MRMTNHGRQKVVTLHPARPRCARLATRPRLLPPLRLCLPPCLRSRSHFAHVCPLLVTLCLLPPPRSTFCFLLLICAFLLVSPTFSPCSFTPSSLYSRFIHVYSFLVCTLVILVYALPALVIQALVQLVVVFCFHIVVVVYHTFHTVNHALVVAIFEQHTVLSFNVTLIAFKCILSLFLGCSIHRV
jgi:hypothetical protein